jgi:hypothetical protein
MNMNGINSLVSSSIRVDSCPFVVENLPQATLVKTQQKKVQDHE